MNRIAQCQRSLNSTNNTLIIAENWLPIKVESVKMLPGRFRCPAVLADTKIAMEEIFDVDTTTPGVIRFKVTVISPVICREYVGPPQTHVPFRVPIPLGARRHLLDLFHFLARVSCSAARRDGYHRCEGTNRDGKLSHCFSLLVLLAETRNRIKLLSIMYTSQQRMCQNGALFMLSIPRHCSRR